MELKRQHPIKIIDYSSKSFWLLSIPLIRGLFYLQFDLWAWIQGAWFDIFVLLVILIYGFFQCRITSYNVCYTKLLRVL